MQVREADALAGVRRGVRRVLFSRVEHVDRVEILCKILDLIHQSYTVYLLQKGLTLLTMKLNIIFPSALHHIYAKVEYGRNPCRWGRASCISRPQVL